MTRVRVGAVVLAALAVAATQAHAAPVAYDARFLAAELRLVGADGADWRLLLHATQLGSARTETPTSGDAQELRVEAQRCPADTCQSAGSWRIALEDRQIEVSDDSTSARLEAVLFGRRLSLALTPTGLETGTVHIVVAGASAGPGEGYANIARTVRAGGPVTLGGLTCQAASGAIGQEVVVAEEALPATGEQVAPAGLLDGDAAARCGV
jgi:hypothetical protein